MRKLCRKISGLDQAGRIKLALYLLNMTQAQLAERVKPAYISVRKALNDTGTGRHEEVLDLLEEEVEKLLGE